MNKRGKGNGVMVGLMAILIIGLLGVGYFAVSNNVSGGGKDITTPSGCPESTGKITVNSFSALSKATNLTPTLVYGETGQAVTNTLTSGTTALAVGTEVTVVASVSDYIDTELTGTVKCGGLVLENPMYYSTSDNPAIRFKNDDGDFVTDAVVGGAVNQTNVNAGETIRMKAVFDGSSLESSGDGILVIELPASTSGNVTRIEMPGLNDVSIPRVHTLLNAGAYSIAFEVPAVVGSDSKEYGLNIVLGDSKDLSGGVYGDWYSKQKFVDTDGTVKYGVENKDGTAKYENTLDSDFFINSA